MKHLLIVLVLSLVVGCASFDQRAEWPDSAYGGPLEAVALEGFDRHHSAWMTDPETSPHNRKTARSMSDMHINPDPIATCTTHSLYVMKELRKRGIDYNVLILTRADQFLGDSHSVVEVNHPKLGKVYIELNSRELYPAEEYKRVYDGFTINLGSGFDPEDFYKVLTMRNIPYAI